MWNRIITIAFLLIDSLVYAQDFEIYGLWTTRYSQEIHRNRESPLIEKHIQRLFVKDGIGYFINSTHETTEFRWTLMGDSIELQDDIAIPWTEKYALKYSGSVFVDKICLEQTCRRNTFKEIFYLSRNNVRIVQNDSIDYSKIEKEDIAFANNSKIIKEQEPMVISGFYDENLYKLYIPKESYTELFKFKGYGQLELFIKGYRKRTPDAMASFLVVFNTEKTSIQSATIIKGYKSKRH